MTKYILVGGYPHKAHDGGKAFVEELVRGFGEPVKILDCLFARPRESWVVADAQNLEFFKEQLPSVKFDAQIADPDKFVDWDNE